MLNFLAQSLPLLNSNTQKMKNLFLVLFVIIFSLASAQKSENVGDFTSIEAFDKLTVELIPSDKNSIEITGTNANNVQFINKNKRLKLRMPLDQFLQGDDTKVKVYFKQLHQIFANEGAHINSKSKIESPSLLLNAKSGASIHLNIEANSLDIKTNTGGNIFAEGNANQQSVVCNTGGIYNGENLQSKTTDVTVNAGGEAKVNASELVQAKTRAGGNIHIFGGAEVQQQKFAGGNIQIH